MIALFFTVLTVVFFIGRQEFAEMMALLITRFRR